MYSKDVSSAAEHPKEPKKAVSNWNIANLLTVVRVFSVPFFVWALMADHSRMEAGRYLAFFIFLAAAITDKIDGDLARSRGLITNFGKIADPIADKALLGAALVCLSLLHELPWWIPVLILAREIGITLLRFVVIKYEVVPASRGGKIKTILQITAVCMFILPLTHWLSWFGFYLAWGTMLLAVGVTLMTGIEYVRHMLTLIAEKKAAKNE